MHLGQWGVLHLLQIFLESLKSIKPSHLLIEHYLKVLLLNKNTNLYLFLILFIVLIGNLFMIF